MSRVTVREFYNDISDINIEDLERYEKIKHTEIVPRKIVEMIIEQYDRIIDDSEKEIEYFKKNSGVGYTATVRKSCARELKEYAESLLKQFEEDE